MEECPTCLSIDGLPSTTVTILPRKQDLNMLITHRQSNQCENLLITENAFHQSDNNQTSYIYVNQTLFVHCILNVSHVDKKNVRLNITLRPMGRSQHHVNQQYHNDNNTLNSIGDECDNQSSIGVFLKLFGHQSSLNTTVSVTCQASIRFVVRDSLDKKEQSIFC
uniref:Uncharacterized protein n=1 Tax=Trichobilharzia regenti TaxID=157069 RepID=A0AA85JGF5_TRIRE|nr:unnamed protein product [Trichobilharzia regenti]